MLHLTSLIAQAGVMGKGPRGRFLAFLVLTFIIFTSAWVAPVTPVTTTGLWLLNGELEAGGSGLFGGNCGLCDVFGCCGLSGFGGLVGGASVDSRLAAAGC